MLAGNILKMCIGVSFEINSILVQTSILISIRFHEIFVIIYVVHRKKKIIYFIFVNFIKNFVKLQNLPELEDWINPMICRILSGFWNIFSEVSMLYSRSLPSPDKHHLRPSRPFDPKTYKTTYFDMFLHIL